MSFIPHTDSEREAMLSAIGIARIEELFAGVPDAVRFPALRIPDAVSQMDVETELRALAGANVSPGCKPSFLGAGIYDHYRPATVDSVLRRGELYSSYTPYQPEISQGMLQAMFEFQTMICRLTGMDVCTASHYEGATSLAEAVLLALAATDEKRTRIVMSPAVHPHYRQVVSTYLLGMPATIVGADCGMSGANQYRASVDEITAALVIQSPNFLGQVEDLTAAAAQAHKLGALLIVMTDPISLGLLKPPGAYGADIVVADGQCLGLAPSFGGPSLGIFAARSKFVRRLPGRLVGETTDGAGRRGYVLTLGTREQHIRRAKATSNICTNSALGALAASVYLATLGRHGLGASRSSAFTGATTPPRLMPVARRNTQSASAGQALSSRSSSCDCRGPSRRSTRCYSSNSTSSEDWTLAARRRPAREPYAACRDGDARTGPKLTGSSTGFARPRYDAQVARWTSSTRAAASGSRRVRHRCRPSTK